MLRAIAFPMHKELTARTASTFDISMIEYAFNLKLRDTILIYGRRWRLCVPIP